MGCVALRSNFVNQRVERWEEFLVVLLEPTAERDKLIDSRLPETTVARCDVGQVSRRVAQLSLQRVEVQAFRTFRTRGNSAVA